MTEFFSPLVSLMQGYPWVGWVSFGLLGLCLGSFANVVVYRLPIMEDRAIDAQLGLTSSRALPSEPVFNLMVPRSRCKACGHQIRWYENIPVLSYLVLRGKCSVCQTPISSRYLTTEVVVGCLFTASVVLYGPSLNALSLAVLMAVLVVLAQIDLERMELPDVLVWPVLWSGLLLSWSGQGIAGGLDNAFLGVVLGYLSLWLLAGAYRLWRGCEGLGGGDIKLLAALGAWVGPWELHNVLLCGGLCLLAAYSVHLPLLDRVLSFNVTGTEGKNASSPSEPARRHAPIPFGPFLVLGAIAVILTP